MYIIYECCRKFFHPETAILHEKRFSFANPTKNFRGLSRGIVAARTRDSLSHPLHRFPCSSFRSDQPSSMPKPIFGTEPEPTRSPTTPNSSKHMRSEKNLVAHALSQKLDLFADPARSACPHLRHGWGRSGVVLRSFQAPQHRRWRRRSVAATFANLSRKEFLFRELNTYLSWQTPQKRLKVISYKTLSRTFLTTITYYIYILLNQNI